MGREVSIPFKPFFWTKIERGEKTMTCRTRRYGHPGDWFRVGESDFVIRNVERVPLGTVKEKHFREEGCASPEEFEKVWRAIYRGFDHARMVWAHRWEPLPRREVER